MSNDQKIIEKFFIYLKFIFVLLIIYCSCSFKLNAKSSSHKILAHVDESIITTSNLNERLKLIAFFNQASYDEISNNQEMRSNLLKSMIEEKILSKRAKKMHIKISDKEKKSEINEFFENLQVNLNAYGSLEKFLKANDLSQDAFHEFILSEITLKKIIENSKDELNENREVKKMFKELNSQKTISEYEGYELFEFSIDKDNESLIKSLSLKESTSSMKQLLDENAIECNVNEIKTNQMNADLLNQIKMQADKKIGFISFKSNEQIEGEASEKVNFIAFAPVGKKKISKINLDDSQLNFLMQKSQIRKTILDLLDDAHSKHYILLNE